MNFAEAFATVGIALAIALGFCAFFWMMIVALETGTPSDYVQCIRGCKDNWGNYKDNDLKCPEMCLKLSEDYKFNAEYWWNNGEGRTLDNVDPGVLNDTLNYFHEQIESYCYFPSPCYSNSEDFLNQFPNNTIPNTVCYYAVYCKQQ